MVQNGVGGYTLKNDTCLHTYLLLHLLTFLPSCITHISDYFSFLSCIYHNQPINLLFNYSFPPLLQTG